MKIAIIGAGTIGLYLGWKLSEKGHQTTIFERKKQIGNNACSGLFSERILKFIPQSKKLIENKINFAYICFPGKTINLKFSKKFYLINHYKLDKLLAILAKKSGAEIILNKNINSLPKGYDRIIGCDGANSFVRKKLGLADPAFRLGILGYVKGTRKELGSNYVKTCPCKNGFLWKIPRKSRIEYGIMAETQKTMRLFKNFLKKNNIKLKNVKSKIIPQGLILPAGHRITLCGDSTGLTKPWSGGGVIWQLKSAEILLKNFPDFVKYRRETKRFFFPKIILGKLTLKTAYFLGFKAPWLLPKKAKIESDFLL